jgi:hypothetical protein
VSEVPGIVPSTVQEILVGNKILINYRMFNNMLIKETAIAVHKEENAKCEIKEFDPVSPQKIAVFESNYEVKLDDNFKDWLVISNGSNVGPGGFYGIETGRDISDIEFYLKIYPS